VNEFGEIGPIELPCSSISAHNPMLGFIPRKGVTINIPIPGANSGGDQG
jgi:hypothetical protein